MNTIKSNSDSTSFQGIDVAAIEKQLAAMWTKSEPKTPPGVKQTTAVTRACVLNLIIFSSSVDDHAATSALLDEVSNDHPGRFFLIIANRESVLPKLESKASVRCRKLESGRPEICGEQIILAVDGDALETTASAIAPLLVSDVPVFLWWKDAPDYDQHLWEHLVSISDRVVVDSSSFARPLEDIRKLASFLALEESEVKLTDLNWSRLTSWRTLIAAFWDVPVYRTHLDKLQSVSIRYCPANGVRDRVAAKPFLLTGWLASRLGWQSQGSEISNDLVVLNFRAGDQEITVTIEPSDYDPRCSGLVTSISMSTEGEQAGFDVFLSRKGNRLNTEVRIAGNVTAGRTLSYEPRNLGRRLSNELSFFSKDAIFEESLIMAARSLDPNFR